MNAERIGSNKGLHIFCVGLLFLKGIIMRRDSISSKNTEGYVDIVPYTAIKNLDRNGVSKETTHFRKTLRAIFCICEIAGFRVCGRIVLEDLKTGKIWS